MTYRAVDCQGFAGGFTLGAVQAGFKLVGKREMKGGFGVANCEGNRHLLGDDWRAEAVDPVTWSVPQGGADFVLGNPPCSGFSVMSAKHFRGADSPINACMFAFVDYAARVMPQVAVFESVQMARTRTDGHQLMRLLRTRLEDSTGESWTLHHVRHNAYGLGGPSQRKRYFWVASRVPFGVEVPKLKGLPLMTDIIGDLDNLGRTWLPQPYRQPPTWWSKHLRSDTGVVDGMMYVDNPLTRRMADLIKGVSWGPGEHIAIVARRYHEQHGQLPESFAPFAKKIVDSDFNMGFTTPVRWRDDGPGRVITGGSLLTVLHPHLDRVLTHREAARLMGFPDDWNAQPLRRVPGLVLTWGKGITVHCGRWISEWVKRSIDGEPGAIKGEVIGDREYDINLTHSYKSVVQ